MALLDTCGMYILTSGAASSAHRVNRTVGRLPYLFSMFPVSSWDIGSVPGVFVVSRGSKRLRERAFEECWHRKHPWRNAPF